MGDVAMAEEGTSSLDMAAIALYCREGKTGRAGTTAAPRCFARHFGPGPRM